MKKIILSALLGALTFPASADTTDQKWMTIVELKKQGMHCVDDPNCFNRYHPEIPARAKANVGDMIVYHTRDALDTEFTLDSIPADLATVDLGLVHPMTGPVHINGAKRGDAIEVEIASPTPTRSGLVPELKAISSTTGPITATVAPALIKLVSTAPITHINITNPIPESNPKGATRFIIWSANQLEAPVFLKTMPKLIHPA